MIENAEYLNINGKLLIANKACISPDNRSFRYGDGCFETMRVNNGTINLAPFHFDRLFGSLQKLRFNIPRLFTRERISKQVSELTAKNNHPLARVRLTMFRGDGGLFDPVDHSVNYLIQSWPLTSTIGQFNTNGLITNIFDQAVKAADQFSMIKSNSFLPYVMAAIQAKEDRVNDSLLLNAFGNIADATIANVFVFKGDTLLTPPLSDGPVNGVMRRFLIENGPAIGIAIQEASVHPADLHTASEVFLTNAISGIRWVSRHNDTFYQNGRTHQLYNRLVAPLFFG